MAASMNVGQQIIGNVSPVLVGAIAVWIGGKEGWRGAFLAGTDPNRADYASFASFRDPDGNTWVLQERNHRG